MPLWDGRLGTLEAVTAGCAIGALLEPFSRISMPSRTSLDLKLTVVGITPLVTIFFLDFVYRLGGMDMSFTAGFDSELPCVWEPSAHRRPAERLGLVPLLAVF